MILKRAYSGDKLAYRAYYKGNIIWDFGKYVNGQLRLDSECVAAPKALSVYNIGFMDNGVTLHNKKIIDGYVCNNPISELYLSTPIRKMTPQYTYEFFGWSITNKDGINDANEGIILQEQNLEFNNIGYGLYEYYTDKNMFNLEIGELYTINWDGNTYSCVAFEIEYNGISGIACGNQAIIGVGEDSSEPFILGTSIDGGISVCYTLYSNGSHKVSVSRGSNNVVLLNKTTQDTIFYAVFNAFIRSYTACFYLDSELLEEQTVPYGESAIPPEITKEGYIVEWAPSDMTITGDTNFYGVWTRDYILSEITIDFTYSSKEGSYTATTASKKELKNGSAYVVEWDGELYRCVLRDIPGKIYSGNNSMDATMLNCLGNGDQRSKVWGVAFVPDDTGVYSEPFLIGYYDGALTIYTQSKDSTHTISVYAI